MAKYKKLLRVLCGVGGPETFPIAVGVFRAVFRQRYPFHWPELDWLEDRGFWQIMERFGEDRGLNAHRRMFLYEMARLTTRRVGGDTAECGVFKGLGSYLICKAVSENGVGGRRHFAFDSFEGLSRPGASDGRYWSKGDLACDEQQTDANLKEFDYFVTLMKGWIPDRFAEVAKRQFSFVHIDVDLAEPTAYALEFFFPRLQTSGVIVVDDYGFKICPGATTVVDAFVSSHPEASLLRLPVGGGVLMKH